jgi:hypothetical protein
MVIDGTCKRNIKQVLHLSNRPDFSEYPLGLYTTFKDLNALLENMVDNDIIAIV